VVVAELTEDALVCALVEDALVMQAANSLSRLAARGPNEPLGGAWPVGPAQVVDEADAVLWAPKVSSEVLEQPVGTRE
jgi:hypothetical protein